MGRDEGDPTEEVATDQHAGRPEQPARDVVGREASAGHLRRAGHDGGEGAHERDEPREHDGLVAVTVEEVPRRLDVPQGHPAGTSLRVEPTAQPGADAIGELVAEGCGHPAGEDDHDQRDRQDVRGDEHPCGEEEGVARQEEADEQSGLGEDHRREHEHGERPEIGED